MGTGFRLNPKWGFQVHSHPLSNSPLRLSASPVKGREAAFNSVRLSLPSIIFEEDGIILKDPFKGRAFSSAAPQITESDYLQTEELKINVGNSLYKGSCRMVEDAQRPAGEEKSTTLRSPQPCSRSYFSFLMENLDALEETFADSNVLRLEKAILLQLGRLGALKLFNTRLSRTLESSNVFDLSDVPTENIGGHMVDGPASDCLGKRFVRSSKKAKRKSRRERASANANKISSLPLPSKNKGKSFRKPSVSTVNKAFNNRSKRLIISRNEGEMSKGVKMLANLERIRTILEEESGKVASLSCWAEAAGVNEKMLLQYLHFGWRCRDELLRSTRSLVLYLARTYRGLGVAYEDLLQAGNLGVLQGAERFDHTRGYRFSTYAQYWIRKSMSRMVSRHARGIRIPCTMSRTINQIQKARKSLNNSHRKYPEDDEITKLTGLSLNKIRSASKCLRVVGSIDQKIGDSLNAKYLEFMPDTTIKSSEKIVMRQHLKKDLYDLLIGLDMREKEVMVLRYGLKDCRPKSLEEIGSLFKVSKEWIRKIEKKAMTKLRDKETCKNLSFYLDL